MSKWKSPKIKVPRHTRSRSLQDASSEIKAKIDALPADFPGKEHIVNRLEKMNPNFLQSHSKDVERYVDWRIDVGNELQSRGKWEDDEIEDYTCPCGWVGDDPKITGKFGMHVTCPKCKKQIKKEPKLRMERHFEENVSQEEKDAVAFYDSIYLLSGKKLSEMLMRDSNIGSIAERWNREGDPGKVDPESYFKSEIEKWFNNNKKAWYYPSKTPNIFVDIPDIITEKILNHMEDEMSSNDVWLHEYSDDHNWPHEYWHNPNNACPAHDYHCEYEEDT